MRADTPSRPGLWADGNGALWAAWGTDGALTAWRLEGGPSAPHPADRAAPGPFVASAVRRWTPRTDGPLTAGVYRRESDGALVAYDGRTVRAIAPDWSHASAPIASSRPQGAGLWACDTVRPVRLPPVTPFGRLECDKWLPLKTLEEAAELTEASKAWLRDGSDANRTAMVDELADVLQTVGNLAFAFGLSATELEEAMRRCEERNRLRGRMAKATGRSPDGEFPLPC